MVIITTGATHEAMSIVKFALYLTLELVVSFELCCSNCESFLFNVIHNHLLHSLPLKQPLVCVHWTLCDKANP